MTTALTELLDTNMKKVLFVCTGNTCRSPMAEAIFNSFCNKDSISFSAGIYASEGRPVSENSVLALSEIGLETTHRSTLVTSEMMKEYDYVVGITKNHAEILSQNYPEYKEKIFAFPCEVSDPYGQNLDAYKKCRDKIYNGVKAIINEL